MTPGHAAASRRGALVDVLLSLGVMALGIAAAVVALSLPSAGGYSRIGPNVMPVAVSFGLILFGGLLLAECFTGGWRARTPDDPAERGEHGFVAGAFGWVSAGLFAQMALIHTAGFVLAGGGAVCLRRARLRQRTLAARQRDRPAARARRVPVLRALPEREPSGGLVAADPRRSGVVIETFGALLDGFGVALTPLNLLWGLVGVTLGTFVGVLPGVGPALTVAMLMPITVKLDPTGALIMFAGIYYGAMYGGSTTTILLNTPGRVGVDRHRRSRATRWRSAAARARRSRPPPSARSSPARSRPCC